jgi:hypothetical protein
MKTTLGHCLMFCGNLVDYSTKASTRVLTSSTDAECTALVFMGYTNAWWRDFLKEMGLFSLSDPTPIKEDNTSAIVLTNRGSAKRSRHFDIAFYKLKDMVEFKDLELVKVGTKENEADFFTKALPPQTFIRHRDTLMGGPQDQQYFSNLAQVELGDRPSTSALAYAMVQPARPMNPAHEAFAGFASEVLEDGLHISIPWPGVNGSQLEKEDCKQKRD